MLSIYAILNNGQEIDTHTFTISFTYDCFSLNPVVETIEQATSAVSFDLLTDDIKKVALPTLSIAPNDCEYKVDWTLRRKFDDRDMVAAFPSIFSLT